MNHCKSILTAALIAISHIGVVSAEIVACDLADDATAIAILGEPLRQSSPNRQIHVFQGDKISTCLFIGKRNILTVNITQLSSQVVAQKRFVEYTASSSKDVTVSPASGLGDKAAWGQIAREKLFTVILKGDRILQISTSWGDGMPADAQSRLLPYATAWSRKF